MQLDPRVIAIAKQFEPGLPLDNWTDENRRAWTMQLIEQVVFQFPNEGWGAKRADPGRPLSKDAIALKREGHIWAFDLVNGSTRRVNNSVTGVLIDNQVFVPVTGRDHLGLAMPEPTPKPVVPVGPEGDGDEAAPGLFARDPLVMEGLRAIQASIAELAARLGRLEEASVANGSAVGDLKNTVREITAAVSAPRTLTLRGALLGTVVGTLAPPQA
jgi:hypothetical protein